ncbi:hypothetical protein PPL_11599 [Heterostelium album PN500]|uniref:Peptidase C1A papain C-terminal domain-containing protein n=1 Tax=Heterostelium pallidum (strain ATCC 26659 / Pp 5 / PN500) TaxID=670386 RepID=D3BV74_HETP5|nr:hypothetical protein PPL_11599 [Heterostelium album PN500]EFA74631.1 hypothetical protein PPL_11599 [Heterostelium album PN500]|eukprot:XP_020426765.1 hypothetical protein PPL_11599 [Heterostelium album PN500]
MRFISTLLIALTVFAVCNALDLNKPVLDDKFIHNHNANGASWVAGRNPRFEGQSIGDILGLLGTKKPRNTPEEVSVSKVAVPNSFDSRTNWPGCVHAVLNQGQCGSCWAFAASESLSDRLCIASQGAINVTLSPQALVSCDIEFNQGCNGGIPQMAWEYLELHGIPTDSCFPYTSGNGTAPDCQKECSDGSKYQLYKGKTFTLKTCSSVAAIQANVFAYGPIEGTMDVYQDFMSYTSGVYVMTPGSKLLGGHAIKIVGWGTDSTSGLDYWIVQNSWGSDWGMNGFFWIQRGTNMCGIDRDASAGQADISSL